MVICAHGVWRHREDEIAFWSLAPCLKKKKRKEKWKEDKRETRKCMRGGEGGGRKKKNKKTNQTPMTVNWRASVRVCISQRGPASGGEGCLTDGTFNWLHRRGTNVGQSSEEPTQNNAGLLFLTEGPPLDQIIGQAVDSCSALRGVCWRWARYLTRPSRCFSFASPVSPLDISAATAAAAAAACHAHFSCSSRIRGDQCSAIGK